MKKAKKSGVCMGFVIKNSGIIEKCHTHMRLHTSGQNGYFAYENTNLIRENFFFGTIKNRQKTEFVCHNKGRILASNYQLKSKDNKIESIKVNLSDQKWEKTNTRVQELRRYRDALSDVIAYDGEVVNLYTGPQLITIINKINEGDRDAANAHYRLMSNIDLKGETISPIGSSATNPFCGVFDGNRYVISGFKIKSSSGYTAFFGNLKNAIVVNLGICCKVKSSSQAAAFVGYNDGGQIISCHAFADVFGGEMAAGFACVNNGYITKCSVRGTVKPCTRVPKTAVISALTCLLSALILAQVFTNLPTGNSTFPPLPKDDPSASLDKNDTENSVSGVNQASFEFSKNVVFKDKNGYFKLKNPGSSNKIIVVEIQITDEELLEKIGKTGRTSKQIAQIEQAADYDPTRSRMTVAKSGAIRPKYYLQSLKLQTFPDGSQLPKGSYDGIAYLTFYDIVTNECSVVNTQLPIKIIVN